MNDAASVPSPAEESVQTTSSSGSREAGSAVARNALHLVAGQVVLTALSFVMNSALGRSLGPADFGLYFFILSTTNFAYTLVDWGQSHVLIRETAKRRGETGALLGSAIAIRCAGALLAAAGTMAALAALGYETRAQLYTTLYVLLWIPSTVWMAWGMAFRAHERMDADAKVSVFNKILTLLFVLPVLALGGRLLAVILSIGAAGVGALAYAVSLGRKLRFPPLRVTRPSVRELLAAGAPLVLMNLLMMAQTYMEPLLLSLMTPPDVLGWYGAARTLANVLIMPASILTTASFPRIARASHDPEAMNREFGAALRPIVALSVLVGVGTWAFAPFAISLVYGTEGFGGAATILQAIAPTLSLMFLNLLFSTPVLVLGRANQVAVGKIGALVVSGGLAYWSIPWAQQEWGNGAIGVIFAFGVSELLMLAIFAALVPRGALGARFALDLLRALAAGAASLLSLRVLPANEWLAMPAFVLVFGICALALGLFSRKDLDLLLATLRKRAG